MGIDAQLFVKTKKNISKKGLRALSYDLLEAFGKDSFYVNKEYDRHALNLIDKYEQDGPTIEPKAGEQFIDVSFWTRYYGIGYERGNLPLILNITNWLKKRIPECSVWYGGDSSGVLAQELTAEYAELLWDHFCINGSKPYGEMMGVALGDGLKPPYCDFCEHDMMYYGGSNKMSLYRCDGCGGAIEKNKLTGEEKERIDDE